MRPTVTELLRLIDKLVMPLIFVRRDMIYPGSDQWENDAEHSWSLAFVACSLAPRVDPSLDTGKISQYAIVHDLPEVYAGDVSPLDGDKYTSSDKKLREDKAIERIQNEFAEFSWINDTLAEYERRETPEAAFLYAVDKIMPLAYDYIDKAKYVRTHHKLSLEVYTKFLEPHRKKVHTHPVVGKYYDEIFELLKRNPSYFYTKS